MRTPPCLTKRVKGLSLVETLIVLAIFAIIIAAIWATASNAFSNQRKEQLAQQTLQVVNNTRSLFQGQHAESVVDFSTVHAIAAGIFPSEMIVDKAAPDLRHPYATANAVTLVGETGAVTLNIGLGTANTGIPQDACVELLSRLAGTQESGTKIGLLKVNVNGGSDLTMPITPGTAADACTSNINNALAIKFSMP